MDKGDQGTSINDRRENLSFDNMAIGQLPPYREEQLTEAPYAYAPGPGAPQTGPPFRRAPYTGAPYTGAPPQNASFCQQQQQPPETAYDTQLLWATVSVPDNRCLAWFACICCFLPLGIFAIIRANQSREALARGDIKGAKLNAKDSRLYSLVAIVLGVAIVLVSMIILFTNNLNFRSSYVECNCRP